MLWLCISNQANRCTLVASILVHHNLHVVSTRTWIQISLDVSFTGPPVIFIHQVIRIAHLTNTSIYLLFRRTVIFFDTCSHYVHILRILMKPYTMQQGWVSGFHFFQHIRIFRNSDLKGQKSPFLGIIRSIFKNFYKFHLNFINTIIQMTSVSFPIRSPICRIWFVHW